MIDSSEIREKERELDQLKKEYMAEREPCMNTTCTFYHTNHKNHCSWTVFHDECRDYKTDEP